MKVHIQTTGGGVTVTASYRGSSLTAFGKRSELAELFGAVAGFDPFLVEWQRYFWLALYYDLGGVWLISFPFLLAWLIVKLFKVDLAQARGEG